VAKEATSQRSKADAEPQTFREESIAAKVASTEKKLVMVSLATALA
jgi:hypothetical protein